MGVLPTGREPPTDRPTGGMDTQTHAGLLLATVARAGRKRATATPTRVEGADAASGSEFSGGLALGQNRESAQGALERCPAETRLSNAIGSSGPFKRVLQRRMRKTACPVVWGSDGVQTPSLDPIFIWLP